jgi:uncharacterized protein (TIGR02246 family)
VLSAEDLVAIRALQDAYVAAWRENDRDALLRLFTADAVLLPHRGVPPVIGIAAIRQFWFPRDAPRTTVKRFVQTPREIAGSADLAYVWGSFSLCFALDVDGHEQRMASAGTYLMIVQRQPDNAWRISHRMWDDPPFERQ